MHLAGVNVRLFRIDHHRIQMLRNYLIFILENVFVKELSPIV